jgi:hypothetical protein
LTRIALALWGGLYLVLGPLRAPGDGDLYWQRWLGDLLLQTHRLPTTLGPETFTAPGAPWVAQEWLFSLAVAAATNHHVFLLLSIAVSALPLAILASIYLRARDVASPEAIGIALFLSGLAFLESFGVRAQVLGWGALSAFTLFLERRDRWYYAAAPTAIVWANLHASVAIAPAIVLARITATVADHGLRGLRASRDLLMLPAVLLATFCTPLGWRLPAFAIAFAGSPIRHFIQEWQPSALHDLSFTLGALPLALAIGVGGRKTLSRDKLRSFPAAVLFVAALIAFRNTALFAIVAAPLAATGLGAALPCIRALGKKAAELEPVAIPTICLAMLVSAIAITRIQYHEPARLPIAAIASLNDGADHRLFCENFTWCSVALAYPTLRVFIDGRCDAYPLAIWHQYISAIDVGSSWGRPLRAYGVDTVVARRGSPFAIALAESADWKRGFEDRAYVVFRHE